MTKETKKTIKSGDKVKVHYTGSFENGQVFDSSEKHGQPLEFTVGNKQVIDGFDKALIGMEKDQEKDITIPALEAYGEHNDKLVFKVPKDKIPNASDLKEGMLLGLTMPNGAQAPALVKVVEADSITLDLNHPLAGKTLKFKLKVVDFGY